MLRIVRRKRGRDGRPRTALPRRLARSLTAAACVGAGLAVLLLAGCGGDGSGPSADELIETIASSSDPEERADAATELAGLLDPRGGRQAVRARPHRPGGGGGRGGRARPLAATYRDPDSAKDAERRAAAIATLAPIDQPEAVKSLWPPLVRELTEIASVDFTTQSRAEQLDSSTAETTLAEIAGADLSAVRPLLRALEQRDYELIADLSSFYIALGEPGSQPILADTVANLYTIGDERYGGLPFEFLSAGNPRLNREVRDALEGLGFTVTGSGGGFPGLQWGSSGAYN